MEIIFYKLNIGKNDILLVDCLKTDPPEDPAMSGIAKSICRRYKGVGANGILFILPGKEEKTFIRYFLSDGREPEEFNDPLICLAKYLFDRGLIGKDSFKVETISGIKKIEIIDSENFRLCPGKPLSIVDNNELREEPNSEYSVPVVLNNKNYNIIPLKVQTGGIVLFADNLSTEKYKPISKSLKELPELKSYPLILTQVISRESIIHKIEHIKGLTDTISAASISAVASVISGFTDREILVNSSHAEIYVQWTQPSNKIYATASAKYVFSGTYYIE